MNQYIFIKTYNGSRGKGASVHTYPKESFLDGEIATYHIRLLQVAKIGNTSKGLFEVGLTEFEDIFNADDIDKLQNDGVLDYYPKGEYIKPHISTPDRYPIFKKEIYVKYGVQKGSKKL